MRRRRRARRESGEAVKLFVGARRPGADRGRICAPTARRNSPATRCPSTSSSATSCPRPMSARSCAARCATRHERRGRATLSPADVVAFWREAGPSRWYQEGRRFRRPKSALRFLELHEAAAEGRLDRWEAKCRGRAGTAHSARPVPAQHVPRAGARLRHRSAGARDRGRRHRARLRQRRCPTAMRGFFYLPFEHSEDIADQERGLALYKAGRRRRRAEMGGTACRHHPPLRPFPASQRGARPRRPRRRSRRFSTRRVCGVMALSVIAGLSPGHPRLVLS